MSKGHAKNPNYGLCLFEHCESVATCISFLFSVTVRTSSVSSVRRNPAVCNGMIYGFIFFFLPLCSSPDPVQWSTDQVLHWVVWVMKEFSMTDIDLGALSIPGRELCSFSQEDFFQRVPRGEILWSHLELLRKCMGSFTVMILLILFPSL